MKSDFVQRSVASHLDRSDIDCYGFHSLQEVRALCEDRKTTDMCDLWDRDFGTFSRRAPDLFMDDSQTDALIEISRCGMFAREPLLWSSCGEINRHAPIAYNQIFVTLTQFLQFPEKHSRGTPSIDIQSFESW